jgi:hypothetical protein
MIVSDRAFISSQYLWYTRLPHVHEGLACFNSSECKQCQDRWACLNWCSFLPHWLEILAEGAGEVVDDDGRRGAVVEAEGEGLLPRELGREPVGVRARVPGHGARDAPGSLLLGQRQPEEVAGAVQRGTRQGRVHAVPAHLEEPVRRARRGHLRRGAVQPRAVAIAQHAHVHHRHAQLRGRGRARVVVRPHERRRDLGLPAQVEHGGRLAGRVGPVLLGRGEVNAGGRCAEEERRGRAGVHGRGGCALGDAAAARQSWLLLCLGHHGMRELRVCGGPVRAGGGICSRGGRGVREQRQRQAREETFATSGGTRPQGRPCHGVLLEASHIKPKRRL